MMDTVKDVDCSFGVEGDLAIAGGGEEEIKTHIDRDVVSAIGILHADERVVPGEDEGRYADDDGDL